MKKFIAFIGLSVFLLIAGSAMAGSVQGPRSSMNAVEGRGTDVFVFVFEGLETARITVIGDGSTDLDCFVYDSDGLIVASDNDTTDQCVISWMPFETQKYKLKIKNLGRVTNTYRITNN